MTPPHITRISGLLSFRNSFTSSGTSVLCPAASVLTPTQWTSASTACWATSSGVCRSGNKTQGEGVKEKIKKASSRQSEGSFSYYYYYKLLTQLKMVCTTCVKKQKQTALTEKESRSEYDKRKNSFYSLQHDVIFPCLGSYFKMKLYGPAL